jgi:hypothetical protein
MLHCRMIVQLSTFDHYLLVALMPASVCEKTNERVSRLCMRAGALRKVPQGIAQHDAIFTHVMVTFLYWREIYIFHFNT